jgi:2-polyprenyl-3-methyl-5-hydroxy-6-metoxy-1,4-benzoquinol methylase
MKKTLELTGERLLEEVYQLTLGGYVIYVLHNTSYQFAEKFCADKTVLDLGCGSGYGSSLIADIASEIQAVDVSEESVQYASQQYKKSNLFFSTIKPDTSLPFTDERFDVVLSFQVIEHVLDHDQYLKEASRVLKEDGTLILITPDRINRLLSFQKPWNRWHLREYDMPSLSQLTMKYFDLVDTLKMGARQDVANIEIKRYRFLKWATLLFTLPIIPEGLRRGSLDLIHKIKPQRTGNTQVKPDYGFGSEVVTFKHEDPNSLNLVIVARKKQP